MLTKSKVLESSITAAMSQVAYSPVTCLNSISHATQQMLKMKSLYSVQADEDGVKHSYLNKSGYALVESIAVIKACPFLNGQIAHCTVSPFLKRSHDFLVRTLLINVQKDQPLNETWILKQFQGFKQELLTRGFDEQSKAWKASVQITAKQFDDFMHGMKKQVKGFDIHELLCIYPLDQQIYPHVAFSQQSDFGASVDKEIVRLISQSRDNQVCGIISKLEISINQQLIRRFLIFTERQYIDDPSNFTNFNFMADIKRLVEPNSNNRVVLVSNHLNGLSVSNKYLKGSVDFKEQVKLLKTYLVGTDQLIRAGNGKSTCEFLFSKFEIIKQ